ncbi:MAG: DUF4147 domain-containing protein [Planctomycetes bacterium]|nr:DUF4147 domain-containing protein [Planctomycetota bacterium]
MSQSLREQALSIWKAGVDAVRPEILLPGALREPRMQNAIEKAKRIIVVGAGKAGSAMSVALEQALGSHLAKVEGIVNVPADTVRATQKIQLHAARPAGSNHPTAEGVAGSERMLELVSSAGPEDIGICLLSGGGSALLPAPAKSISLADKQVATRLLHSCGATIHEMNAVRKHLSRIKGGRLAQAFTGRSLDSLVISDVVGDPLDVIASGPTAADPSTFADAWAIIERFDLVARMPIPVVDLLREGMAGRIPETLKTLPAHARNVLIGNSRVAIDAAKASAMGLGYRVLDLGSFIEGETRQVAIAVAGIVRSIQEERQPFPAPACLLIGGETTVTLPEGSGKGGRNQEFVLALAAKLGPSGMKNVAALSGGTDGEDGPTGAAGGVVDEEFCRALVRKGLLLETALANHDAYPMLEACDALIRTGPTQTNVMDLRVFLIM